MRQLLGTTKSLIISSLSYQYYLPTYFGQNFTALPTPELRRAKLTERLSLMASGWMLRALGGPGGKIPAFVLFFVTNVLETP